MRRNKKAAMAAATLLLATVAINMVTATAAQAAVWKAGVKVSKPNWSSWPGVTPIVSSYVGSAQCDYGDNATAVAKRVGDYLYVRDDCADGRSAVAKVTIISGSNTGDAYVCRNSHGNGTWARCDFNWPENVGMSFAAGVYNGDTGYLKWDYANDRLFQNND